MSEFNKHFALEYSFPDAAGIFKNTFKTLDEIKGGCLVGLDTNVLLQPYSLDAASIEEIRPIYAALAASKRLLIPGRVAREFARRRTSEIAKLIKTLRDQGSATKNPIAKKIEFLRTDTDYKKILKLGDQIQGLSNDLRAATDKVVAQLQDWATGDAVLKMYAELLANSIFDPTFDKDAQANFSAELKFRYEQKIPPGYRDNGKPDEGSGDLLIWKTILEAAKANKQRDFLFVTDETKNDWWIKAEGTVHPRYELTDEYRRSSEGGTLHLTQFPRFLKLFGAPDNVVSATEKVAQEAQNDRTETFDPILARRDDLTTVLHVLETRLSQLRFRVKQASGSPYTPLSPLEKPEVLSEMKLLNSRIENLRREISDLEAQLETD